MERGLKTETFSLHLCLLVKTHPNRYKQILWSLWRFCLDEVIGCFVTNVLQSAKNEAETYMLKEAEVLKWRSIATELALEEASRDGQKLKEKVVELESTLGVERYMSGNAHSLHLTFLV